MTLAKSKNIFAPPTKEELVGVPNRADLFAPPTEEEKLAAAREADEKLNIKPPIDEAVDPMTDKLFAATGRAAQALPLGYGDKLMPKEMNEYIERANQRNPGVGFIGSLAGSYPAGFGIAKGLQALGNASKYAKPLTSTGFRQGSVAGLLEGVASNPGEDGSRLGRGFLGMLLGGATGKGSDWADRQGDIAKYYSKVDKPGFKDEMGKELEAAIAKLSKNYISPRKEQLKQILEEAGSKGLTVDVNPDFLYGFDRAAVRGRPSTEKLQKVIKSKSQKKVKGPDGKTKTVKTQGPDSEEIRRLQREMPKQKTKRVGGLDRYADLLTNRSLETTTKIKPTAAQRLKEYFDELSEYKKPKRFGKDAEPKQFGAYRNATDMRKRLSGLDERVYPLNKEMSDALRLRQALKNAKDSSGPVDTISKDPWTSTDRAQDIIDLDAMAGTKLKQMGERIRAAKRMKPDPDSSLWESGTKLAKRGAMKVGGTASKWTPTGTKEAIILKILDGMKKQASEEEE